MSVDTDRKAWDALIDQGVRMTFVCPMCDVQGKRWSLIGTQPSPRGMGEPGARQTVLDTTSGWVKDIIQHFATQHFAVLS